jgi:hypothetical protein
LLRAWRLNFSLKRTAKQILESDDSANTELFNFYSEKLRKAVDNAFHSDPQHPAPGKAEPLLKLSEKLRSNLTRFAAAKTLLATRNARREYVDTDTGEILPRSITAPQVLQTYQQYLDAEYNTATTRALSARQWTQFTDPDKPNIEWLPSASLDPRHSHKLFYHRIWPKSSPFWNDNSPGSEFNCKCDWRETAAPPTDNSDINFPAPQPGLEGNPASTGKIFTDNASYFKKTAGQADHFINSFYPNFQRFNSLLDDLNYSFAQFNYDKGNFLAVNSHSGYHDNDRETFFGLPKQQLEYNALAILLKNGCNVITNDETQTDTNGKLKSMLDTQIQLPGEKSFAYADIVTITQNAQNTIRNILKRKNKQIQIFKTTWNLDADSLILYFHISSWFNQSKVLSALKAWQSTPDFLIRRLIVIADGKIYQM